MGQQGDKAGVNHLDRVHSIPCVLCAKLGLTQLTRTTAHHVRTGQGASQRADDMLTAAICEECHQGPQGVHGDRGRLKMAGLSELMLVALTLRVLYVAPAKSAPTKRQAAPKRKGSTDRPSKLLPRSAA